jgi:hypothetical protein
MERRKANRTSAGEGAGGRGVKLRDRLYGFPTIIASGLIAGALWGGLAHYLIRLTLP